MNSVTISDMNGERSVDDLEDDEDDIDYAITELEAKYLIRDALENVHSVGTFATTGDLPSYVDPIIFIPDGKPPINLPLQEADARRLIAASHEAPFGKGAETIVDASVRRTWELNSDQFRICNAAFQQVEAQAVGRACAELGVPTNGGNIRFSRYKLLIYEKGAMFKPHTDTEKAPGMFGTFVICLPSAHEGGEAVLSHQGVTKRIATAGKQHCYAAWYSDVVHEICEVTAGYRLVITYNLIQKDATMLSLSAPNAGQHLSMLRTALKTWVGRKTIGAPSAGQASELIWPLDHKYSTSQLVVDRLKGRDREVVAALNHLATELKFTPFLASMEHEVVGEPDVHDYQRGWYDDWSEPESDENEYHPIDTVLEEETHVSNVRTTDDEDIELLAKVQVSEDSIIHEDYYDDRDPDDHSYQGYTGNAGAQSTHWYRDTVVILVPNENLPEFLLMPFVENFRGDNRAVPAMLDWLERKLDAAVTNQSHVAAIRRACQLIAEQNSKEKARQGRHYRPWIPFDDAAVTRAFQLAVKVGAYDLLGAVATCGTVSLPASAFRALSVVVKTKFADVADGLAISISMIDGLGPKFAALKELFDGEFVGREGPAATWASSVLREAVTKSVRATRHDARAVMELAVLVNDKSLVKAYMERTLAQHFAQTDSAIAFLAAWLSGIPGLYSGPDVAATFNKLYSLLMQRFRFDEQRLQGAKRLKTGADQEGPSTDPESVVDDLLTLLRYLLDTEQADSVVVFFNTLEKEAGRANPDVLRTVLVPLLCKAQVLADKNKDSVQFGPLFRSLYRNVLESYLQHFVKQQPPSFENWARPRVPCSCGDCWNLNLFLISATQQVGRFAVGKSRRHHLHLILDQYRVNCTHLTERIVPETLVVTKQDRRRDAYAAWTSRCQEAAEMMRSIDPKILSDMLGRRYEKIVRMWSVIGDESSAPEFVKTIPLAKDPPTVIATGSKRKVEVIDLGDSLEE